jgi:hypothetical protein
MLKFIKDMANEGPFVLFFILVFLSGVISNITNMIVSIVRICVEN